MFLKADGTEVWLRSSRRLAYLSLAGEIETSEEYSTIRSRLCRAYKLLPGVASDDAFLVLEHEDSGAALLFCAGPDKNCALLLLGKFLLSGKRRTTVAVLEKLGKVVESCIDEISRRAGVTIRLEVVQPEIAMQDFDLQY
ncbi:hypothetical protein U8C35_29015 (plasmid) [Sinorhizobium medicae]|uniref:hypothetical protein n=1 Tax=Sinorhizobium medicae TaxID=110321 RepID=UPI002AF6A422|nr:hypothetical protein [Sinorhizobium medicae]WQO62163.1 hypothetical protein U8C35_29015 [Sinorhizobium medicae]